jgi:hypothetical protein
LAEFTTLVSFLASDAKEAVDLRRTLLNHAHNELKGKVIAWLYHRLEIPGVGTVVAVLFGEESYMDHIFPE